MVYNDRVKKQCTLLLVLTLAVYSLIACNVPSAQAGQVGATTMTGNSAQPGAAPAAAAVDGSGSSGKTIVPTAVPTPLPTATPIPPLPPLDLRDDVPEMTLKDWPRPAGDNGLGMHFIPTGYYDAEELDKEIARMQAMHLKWALVLYADENHLQLAAQKFKDAGIMVVWRKTIRPYQRYQGWARDVQLLRDMGVAPYMQLYNEPELPAEWEGQPMDTAQFFSNLFQAARDVYNAGGYPGIQFIDEDSLRQFISLAYARQGQALFHRMFFVAHAVGVNHPPNYVEDTNGVLGFRHFATLFFKRLGFVPPIIIGEGGWTIGNHQDTRFPAVDDTVLRDYTLAVADWFRSGKLSNGAPLPDYLFAFSYWIIAGTAEDGAWFGSPSGDRTQAIQGLQNLPVFVRKFSWK